MKPAKTCRTKAAGKSDSSLVAHNDLLFTTEDPSQHVQADVRLLVGEDGGVFSTINDDPSKHVHADVLMFVGEDGGVFSTINDDPSKHVHADVLPLVGEYGGTTTEDPSQHVQADEQLFGCDVFLNPDLILKNTPVRPSSSL